MRPTFSIIIPTYNRAHLIKRGIESVINQTYKNWELIILDDGSEDNTKDVVQSFIDGRIQYFHQDNKGRSAARNYGLGQATGEWICFLDSDDWYEITALESYKAVLSKNTKIVRSLMQYVGNSGRIIYKTKSYTGGDQTAFLFRSSGSILHYCFHHSVFEKHKFYDLEAWEDQDLLFRLFQEHQFTALDKITVNALDHCDRSVHKPISSTDALRVIHRMENTLGDLTDARLKKLAITNQVKAFVLTTINQGGLAEALRLVSDLNYRWSYFTFYIIFKFLFK